MDIILPEKYAIKFNAEFVPPDFDKWIKLEPSGYEKNSIIKLNNYFSIIIKSKEEHILLQIGGCNYIIKQNLIYFPFFPLYHEINLTLSPNIDIYTNPICEFNENTELNKIMIYNWIIFCGLKIIDYINLIDKYYQYEAIKICKFI